MAINIFEAKSKLTGRILILEDDPVTGTWLGQGLSKIGIECHFIDNLDEALGFLQFDSNIIFHGVVTDVFMKDGSRGGLTLLKHAVKFDLPVCVITSKANLEIAKEALNSGACHLLEKPFEISALSESLIKTWQEPKFLSAFVERAIELQQLTKKESEVCRLVMKGLSNKEIASVLSVTEKTVKFHVTSIFEKFEVKSRSELASSIFPT